MITNTNGLVDNIYHYFWLKDESLLKESFSIRIPDTIIFKNGIPQMWYFTNKDAEIQTKKAESRQIVNIINHFTKNIKQGGHIVGYYIYPEKYNNKNPKEQDPFQPSFSKTKVKLLDSNEKICIYYLSKDILIDFLNSPNKPPEGILQKFIEPLGINECLIQAIWSPSVCIMSKKQNNRDLYDMSYDPYERCTTFDGGEAYSRVIPLRGKQISQEIRKQCQMIVQKVTNLSYGQTNLSRIIFYFKPDQNNKVWFLYCSSVRVQGEAQSQIKLFQSLWGNSNVKKNNTPIPFNTNYQRPHMVKNMMTVNTMHPVKLNKDIECFECSDLCQQQDLYHLTYEFIIKHFEQDINQNPLHNQIKVIMPKSFTQGNDYLRDIHSHIPPLILKLYPSLTVNLYEQMKINDAFLIKNILICETCFLKYSQADPSVSGAKLRIKQSKRPVRMQSASLLQKRPELKEYLIEKNLDLIESKKKTLRIHTHFSTSNLGSFNVSNHSTNIQTLTNKFKHSMEIQFDSQTINTTQHHRLHTAK